jgi:chitinase
MIVMRRMVLSAAAFFVLHGLLYAQSNWVTAYYASWAKWNNVPVNVEHIDFSAATHWVLFTIGGSESDGSFDLGQVEPEQIRDFVAASHAAGKKAILGTGGWGSNYSSAVNNRASSIQSLMSLINTYGFDGVDIDWEPVPGNLASAFISWMRDLKAALGSRELLCAAFSYDQAVVDASPHIDQVNLMTYDMSGPWPGWVSWHNSPIYNGGNRFPSSGGFVPSIDGVVQRYIDAGVPASKLGFGIEFYGYIWNNVTGPMQDGFGTVSHTVPYAEIMDRYAYLPLQWDDGAKAAYYSASNQFISFEPETTMHVKADYMRQRGLGGVIIYEVAAGYRGSQPVGYRDILLQTVKQAFLGGPPPPPDSVAPTVEIVSPADQSVVTGEIIIQATASDNVGVAGIQFTIDGEVTGIEDRNAPFTMPLNTWLLANGSHTVSAVARDWSNNSSTATITLNINNQGPPPVVEDKIIYDDSLREPFQDASWSASVDYSSTTQTKNSSYSIRVNYSWWGGFDLLSGTWQNTIPIDPTKYDSLKFDIYPTSQFKITIGFYNGQQISIQAPANTWTSYSIPLSDQPFSRFYFGSQSAKATRAYFDNLRLAGKQIPTSPVEDPFVPRTVMLEQNYPNPFNPSTTIAFSIPKDMFVKLDIYDVLGNRVATLLNKRMSGGRHEVVFDTSSSDSTHLSSGVYLYQLIAGSYVETRKLMLVR